MVTRRATRDVHWGKDHEVSLTLKVNTSRPQQKKLSVAWEWVEYQLPVVTSTPNLQGTKAHSAAGLIGEPRRGGLTQELPHTWKPLAEASISMAVQQHMEEFTPKTNCSLQSGEKNPPPNHQSQVLGDLHQHSPLHRALQKNTFGAVSRLRMKAGERQIFFHWIGLGLTPCSQTQRQGPTSLPLVHFEKFKKNPKKPKQQVFYWKWVGQVFPAC